MQETHYPFRETYSVVGGRHTSITWGGVSQHSGEALGNHQFDGRIIVALKYPNLKGVKTVLPGEPLLTGDTPHSRDSGICSYFPKTALLKITSNFLPENLIFNVNF